MHIIPENDAIITYLLKLISEEHILTLLSTMDLSTLVTTVKEKTDEFGCKPIQTVIEVLDQNMVESENRKKQWTIQ